MYTTYSKAGWIGQGGYYNVLNCAGIVNKSSPYVLAIMSNSSGTAGMSQMKELVAQLDAVHSEMIR